MMVQREGTRESRKGEVGIRRREEKETGKFEAKMLMLVVWVGADDEIIKKMNGMSGLKSTDDEIRWLE